MAQPSQPREFKKLPSMQLSSSDVKKKQSLKVAVRPGRSRMLNRGGTSDSYAIGSIRQYGWLRRLFLEPDKLELQRGEISVRKNSEPHTCASTAVPEHARCGRW
jgi:hypothetical protein